MDREEQEELKSKIDKANEALYKPGAPDVIHAEPDFSLKKDEEISPISGSFQGSYPKAHILDSDEATDKVGKIFRKLLLAAIGFFIISLGVFAFIYFYGNNTVSSRNIAIVVNSPPSVASSDLLSFDVSIENGNNAELQDTSIVIDYPEGTRSPDDETMPLISQEIKTGNIEKGQIARQTVSAKLFGEENSVKKINITFKYSLSGSKTTFSKKESFDVALRLAPVVLSVEGLKEVNTDQEITLTARVLSNSNNVIKDASLEVTYPFGFSFIESNVEVATGPKGEFPLGDIYPNDSKEVVIKGKINGQSAEDKIFKFRVKTGETLLVSYDHDMVIAGDFLSTAISFNNGASIMTADNDFRGVVSWKNTLNVPISDAEFILKVSGDLIEEQGISVEQGYYDSGTKTILWNKSTNPNLSSIAPGETSQLRFNIPIASYQDAVSKGITNPQLNFILDIKGSRTTDSNVTEEIKSSFAKKVPILTSVDIATKSLYSTGAFKNTGPIPPKADQKTTYTVVLSLSNSTSNISKGLVVATLPLYVSYEDAFSPQSEKVIWNPNTRQLRWDVGSLISRTGYSSSQRSLSFKVGLTPSKTQVGTAPVLVQGITFTGHDDFAGKDLTKDGGSVTTAASDPGFVFGNDKVVQ